ncbi:MAG: acetylxylan esterase [Clostridia bacterium]|nr:acetylxylan esterase [Clostridia bacterium]
MKTASKKNLMWDTDALFRVLPNIHPIENVKIGQGIEAFKFQSAPYGDKTETWVFGAIGMPATPMPKDGYPAVVLVHGGGGQVFGEWMLYWMNKGFVAIAIDMFGNQLDENLEKVDNPESGPKERDGSNYDGVEDPKQSWVYHSVYNVMMANNLLRARKDVDVERIVVTGISWGGYITNILSGVDQRFAAFAPMYGAGFVYEDGFWTNGYGSFGGVEGRQVWIELYDPSSYLPYSTKPMLYISGLDDAFFSTVNRMKSAALVQGERYYSQRSELPHGHCWMLAHEIPAFFRHVLYGENLYAKVGAAVVKEGVATLQAAREYAGVSFVYTTSTDEDSHKWRWEKQALSAQNGEYSCEIPKGATAYLFETCIKEKDEDIYQSTPVYFTNDQYKY